MSSLQRWVWPPRSSPVPGYDPNPGRVIALPRPINKLHVSQQLCQPGRCRYNQIPGGRDQQSTDWTRRHRGLTKGGGEGGGKSGESEPNRTYPRHKGKTRRQPHQKHRTAATREKSPAAPRKENHTGSTEATDQPKQGQPK